MRFASIILIIALGFAAYTNSLSGKFIRDDENLIRDNPSIKSWPKVLGYFTGKEAMAGNKKWGSYRPLQMATYAADYSLWKLNPFGYHLTNTLFHVMAALSVYWLVSILFGDGLLSLFTGILFVVSPVHTEAVSYISGRADSMSAIFAIFSFIFYVKSVHVNRVGIYAILTLVAYMLALLSRENAFVLPALLGLYHYIFKEKFKRSDIFTIASVGAVTFIYALLRLATLRGLLADITTNTTFFQRIPGFFVALANYARLLLLPLNLHAGYGLPLFKLTDLKVALGFFIILFFLVYAFKRRRTNALLLFSVSWFFVLLLPHSNLYPINAYMAEHWLYLPSMGFFLVVAKALVSLYGIKKFKNAALALLTVLTGFYLCLTIRQNDYWKEPVAFFERTVKSAPDNYGDCVNLGIVYYLVGRKDEAVAEFKKAIKINSGYAEAYYNLGIAYYNLGKKDSAVNAYKKALAINPEHAEALNNLGLAYYDIGRKEEAVDAYWKAVKINSGYADAYYNLGRAYLSLGEIKQAIRAYERVVEINTGDAEVSYNLAILHYHEKNYNQAVRFCDKALELGYEVNPEFAKSLEPYRQDAFAEIRKNMVTRQIKDRGITDRKVIDAMKKIQRHLFVPEEVHGMAYEDAPLRIGYGQTISQPYIVAYMTEAAELGPDDRVLEIGTGSGYQAAVLAEIVKEVYTIEILQPLADSARDRLNGLGYKNIKVKCADGYEGWPEYAPFDAIIVTAAPPEIPKELADQLKVGGRMVVPVGSFYQEIYLITRTKSRYDKKRLLPVRFVPMVRSGMGS